MPNRVLLHAAENKKLENLASTNPLSRPLVERYVAGTSLEEALLATEKLNRAGIDVSLDLLGEQVSRFAQSDQATEEYLEALRAIAGRVPGSTVSVKLSQLGVMIDPRKCEQNLRRLLETAQAESTEVEMDMEQSSVGRETLAIYKSILPEYPRTRLAIQANMRQTPEDLLSFNEIRPRIRLVKGAFDESVGDALRKPEEVTAQYEFLARWALENLPDPAFGTHDDHCIEVVKTTARKLGIDKKDFEFQLLYGVRRPLQEQLVGEGYRVRVYMPYGNEWYPYLMRRMAERPANLLFFLRSLVSK